MLAGVRRLHARRRAGGFYLWQERRLKRRERLLLRCACRRSRRSSGSSARPCRRARPAASAGIGFGSSASSRVTRLRRDHGGDARRLGALRCCSGCAAEAGLHGRRPPARRSARSRSSPRPSRSPTSHEARPRRHLAPSRARRAARAGRARSERGRGWRARLAEAGGREAVVLSTCNRTELYLARDDAKAPRRRRPPRCSARGERRASSACSTGSATRRRRCTSSGSPAGSTRWCPARARSWARCARRGGRAGPGARPALPPGAARRPEGARETAIGESPASVSAAAAALAQQVFGDLAAGGSSSSARAR